LKRSSITPDIVKNLRRCQTIKVKKQDSKRLESNSPSVC
jgi:hypothetical protein